MATHKSLLHKREDKARHVCSQLDTRAWLIEAGDLQADSFISGLWAADKVHLLTRRHFHEAGAGRRYAVEQAVAGKGERLEFTTVEIKAERTTEAIANRQRARKCAARRQSSSCACAVGRSHGLRSLE